MRIIFGENFDSQKFIIGKPSSDGEYLCGPRSLVDVISLFIGTKVSEDSQALRIEKYRKALLSKVESSFYQKSFEKNPIAVTKNILELRDELLQNGFQFNIFDSMPSRIKLLCEVEANFNSQFGYSDIYAKTMLLLAEKRIELPFEEVVVLNKKGHLSVTSVRLLNALSQVGVKISFTSDLTSACEAGTDLDKFIRAISDKEFSGAFDGDGSVRIINLGDDIEAYQHLMNYASNLDNSSYYLPVDIEKFDDILASLGTPALGTSKSSTARPLTQLIRLMEIFLWERMEPSKLLEFLTLKNKPLNGVLARELAGVLSSMPGIDSDGWREAITEFHNNTEIESTARDKAIEQYNFLFERNKYSEESVPVSEVVDLYSGLQSYLKNLSLTNEERRSMISKNISLVEILLNVLNERGTSKTLTKLELDGIISTLNLSLDSASSIEGKDRSEVITSPECIFSNVDNLIWLPFKDYLPQSSTNILSQVEIDFLKSQGVELNSSTSYLSLYESEVNLLKRVNKKLILCIPDNKNGVANHPMLLQLESLEYKLDKLLMSEQEFKANSNLIENKNKSHLPRKKAIWRVDEGLLRPRNTESYSSLDQLINYPFQYVLGYQAKLRSFNLMDINDGSRLLGSFTHRLYEEFFDEHKVQTDITSEFIDNWHRDNFLNLVSKEASVFLSSGREGDLESLKQKSLSSLKLLSSSLRDGNWEVVEMEYEFKGIQNGITISGFVDMLLKRENEYCALDIKWGSAKYYKELISSNKDLQLAIYSKLSPSENPYCHTAFFSILSETIFSKNKLAFNNAAAYPEFDHVKAYSQMMDKLNNSYSIRTEQLRSGRIEVPLGETVDDIESEFDGDSTFDAVESGPRFNDYNVLCGWNDDE